jgi:hypothetical protein
MPRLVAEFTLWSKRRFASPVGFSGEGLELPNAGP